MASNEKSTDENRIFYTCMQYHVRISKMFVLSSASAPVV